MSLTLTDVTVTLGHGDTRTTVFDDLSATFPAGRVTALAGPSGSGKSTLLAVAGALLAPESGVVRLGEGELTGLSDAERAKQRRERIGYMFQSGNLLSALTTVDQLLAAAYVSGHRPRRYRERAVEALEAVDLGHRLKHKPEQLSGGERQRVALARALFLRPELVLVDEPTAAVDRTQAGTLTELVTQQTRAHGCVTLVATHDPVAVEGADQVVDMAELAAARQAASASEGAGSAR